MTKHLDLDQCVVTVDMTHKIVRISTMSENITMSLAEFDAMVKWVSRARAR